MVCKDTSKAIPSTFRCTTTYAITDNTWRHVGLFPLRENAVTVTDTNVLTQFDYNVALNNMLRRLHADHIVQSNLFPRSATTGLLNIVDRILQWIVARIVRPKQGGYSRVDQQEVYLVWLIKSRIPVNWPHFIVKRMFELKESGRGTAIGYASLIQWVLNKVNISSQRLPKKSISIDQEFTKKTLNMM